jgi:hypothetical protein
MAKHKQLNYKRFSILSNRQWKVCTALADAGLLTVAHYDAIYDQYATWHDLAIDGKATYEQALREIKIIILRACAVARITN